MEKVVEAINGDPKPIHPKSKLLTKQSTLRLLDQDTADSVRSAMANKGGESDIDDTDSETEQDPIKRSAKSHHLGSVSKSKSTNLPEPKLTAQATIGGDHLAPSKGPKLLSKEMMTVDVGIDGGMASMDDGAKVRDDLGLNSGAKSSLSDTDQLSDPSSASRSSTEEILITWPQPDAAPIPKQMVLGKEGFLNKQGGKHKTWKHRYVVAVPGRLAYYKSKPNSPGDKPMGVVKLKNVVLSSKPAMPKYSNLFELNSNSQWNKRGTYVFSASTPAERAEWLDCLEILGGDCKAQIEELRTLESNKQDPIGAEKRARSFIHEVSQSIDEDEVCLKPPSIEVVPEEDTIPGIEPSTTKTKRHREGEFDLDISFITDRILVMSFPYSTQELSTFQTKGRNQIDTVERFLSGKYNKSYRVYNLCKENKYSDTRFNGNIGLYPFEDHCSPSLSLIHAFLKDMQQWMGASGSNVSVVHCNSGKGRSGCMVASYLIYAMGMFFNEAIELFNTHRINFGSGLSLPSHLRYIKYIDRIRLKPEFSFDREDEKVVESIQLHTPILCDSEWKPFITIVSVETGTEIFNSMKDGETVQNIKTRTITIRNINLPVRKDVQINFWNFEENVLNELSLVAYLFFNVSFVGNSLQFSKQELDKLFKCKVHSFSISIQFKEGD